MRRWLKRIAWTVAGLVLVVGIAVTWLARASLPQLAGAVAVPGLQGEVTILRDAHAVPHVTAGSEADAYLAMGFLHGQDRLWQMEFDRLAGQGRLAELLGPDALPYDRFMRTLGLAGQRGARRRVTWTQPPSHCWRPMPPASIGRSRPMASPCRPSS